MTPEEERAARWFEDARTTRAEFLRGALASGVALGASGLLSACGGGSSSRHTQKLRQGGYLTIGLGSGSTADSVNPWTPLSSGDASREFALYDSLLQNRGSIGKFTVTNQLAVEVSPNKDATVWTIRLRKGVEFHNGKPLVVDDLIYTFNQILNPKVGAFDRGRLLVFDMKNAKKLDDLTVRIPLFSPVSIVPELLANGSAMNVVPVGFDLKHPVGTGPFKLKSFTPGQQTVLERFPHYWGESAKVDTLTMTVLPDDTARYNALQSGQIDVMDTVPYSLLKSIESNKSFHVSNLKCGQFVPITMRVDLPPFNDVRVRQALRLAVDRNQVIASAYSGAASYGNDLFGLYDPILDTSLVRHQDVEQAKSLLKQAGKQNLTVTLTYANVAPGSVEQCQAFAQSVKAAGINVKLHQVDPGTLFGANYLNWPFAIDTWPGLNYLVVIASNDGPNAHVDETHFNNAKFNSLYKQALATLDPAKRTDIAHEMQMIEFNEGGNIIPAFPNYTAAYSTKVGGFYSANLTGNAVAAGYYNLLGFVA
jgi:peptide/nickel transport system substrate-binding protein